MLFLPKLMRSTTQKFSSTTVVCSPDTINLCTTRFIDDNIPGAAKLE